MKTKKFLTNLTAMLISLIMISSLKICTVAAEDEKRDYEAIIHNIAAKYCENTCEDVNVFWFVSDFAVYKELYPESEYNLSESEKEKCIDKMIDYAVTECEKEVLSPGNLSKLIIALRSLGYDAKNITTSDLKKLDVVSKLTSLVDQHAAGVTNIYTLPYVLIALQQDNGYATVEQISYLIESAISSKDSWQNTKYGTDGLTFMLLALAPYYSENEEVKAVIDEAVLIVNNEQDENGLAGNSAASTGLVLAAFSALDIDSESFLKGLMTQASQDFDGFIPMSNSFSTEQGFRGLLAYELYKNGHKKRIFDFSEYPMNALEAPWAENCPVIFEVVPEDSDVVIEGVKQKIPNKYDLLAGEYTYFVSKDGYETQKGNFSVTEEEVNSHSEKKITVTLEEIIPDVEIESDLIDIKLRIMIHDETECNNSYSYKKNPEKFTALADETVEIKKGESVFEAFKKLADKKGISYIEKNGYVSSVNSVSEFGHGAYSGWMFTVNGKHKNTGCRETFLNTDSTVVWFYTDDYRNEKGSENYGVGTGVSYSKTTSKKDYNTDEIIKKTSEYIMKTAANPQNGSVGGEWAILGLSRSGEKIPQDYINTYYQNIRNEVILKKGILHDKKYTEYARAVIALLAIGANPENIGGYNLVAPLNEYDKVTEQGINGAVWAVIALDYCNSDNDVKEKYIEYILENQLEDGGWALSGTEADSDITAMALQALSKYKLQEKTKKSIGKALICISKMQNKDGGFSSGNIENSESVSQVLTALSMLGIEYNDKRFVKNGNTILDCLMTYYYDNGFKHTKDSENANLMASEQALCALVALNRMQNGKNSIYDMSDAKKKIFEKPEGLSGKNEAIKKNMIKNPGKTFLDIKNHKNQKHIEELAERNVINGKSGDIFELDAYMTRAEFAAIIVRGLGIISETKKDFSDVAENDWFYSYVNAAYEFGIIKGISENEFNPQGKITREEAAVMIARSAKLCGMNKEFNENDSRDILAGFSDYKEISDWAVYSVAFCCESEILSDNGLKINPFEKITRSEIALMLYNMLELANLL